MKDELLLEFLDLVDLKCKESKPRVAAHQKRVAKHFNNNARNRTFEAGDLFETGSLQYKAVGSNCGLCAIEHKLGDETFKLLTVDGTQFRVRGTTSTYDVFSLRFIYLLQIRHTD